MKEEKVKLQTKIFRFIFIFTLIVYLTLYFGNEFGYFEYQKQEQAHLTQEQIKKFEQDIKDGKDVNVEDYLINTNKNYQTKLSHTGLIISNGISKVVRNGVEGFFNSINKLIN